MGLVGQYLFTRTVFIRHVGQYALVSGIWRTENREPMCNRTVKNMGQPRPSNRQPPSHKQTELRRGVISTNSDTLSLYTGKTRTTPSAFWRYQEPNVTSYIFELLTQLIFHLIPSYINRLLSKSTQFYWDGSDLGITLSQHISFPDIRPVDLRTCSDHYVCSFIYGSI